MSKSYSEHVGKICQITWVNSGESTIELILSESEHHICIKGVNGLSELIRPTEIHKEYIASVISLAIH